jgi:hypothetical protein
MAVRPAFRAFVSIQNCSHFLQLFSSSDLNKGNSGKCTPLHNAFKTRSLRILSNLSVCFCDRQVTRWSGRPVRRVWSVEDRWMEFEQQISIITWLSHVHIYCSVPRIAAPEALSRQQKRPRSLITPDYMRALQSYTQMNNRGYRYRAKTSSCRGQSS